ncbi:MAG TPA: hypothetical protein VJ642_04600 [Chromobacteriaceae bacterium]|nr:hypothetical protein [Chromobacteriaceae bacterium]
MKLLFLLPLVLVLSGCNWFNTVTGLSKESNKAIGAACRQTGRSLEECYLLNPDADKASIYAGWREMHEYMAKNKLDTMPPPAPLTPSSAPAAKSAPASAPAVKGKTSEAKPLSSEEADREAKNDPEVEAVLSAIRKQNAPPPAKKNTGDADQKRLLNIIQQLNQQDAKKGSPAPSGSQS